MRNLKIEELMPTAAILQEDGTFKAESRLSPETSAWIDLVVQGLKRVERDPAYRDELAKRIS